jgi:hypothetical protein
MLSGLKRWFMEHVAPVLEVAATNFVHALAQDIETSGGELLRNLATAGVQAAEIAGGTGSDKFSNALTYVKAALKNEGQKFVENAVQGAILAAVASLHADQYKETGKG